MPNHNSQKHLLRAISRDLFRLKHPVLDDHLLYLQAGIDWLCAAQDANPEGGVSRSFSLKTGWGECYPETTGYIIPTLLNYAWLFKSPDIKERAIKMAHWLSDIQHPEGGIQSGTVNEEGMLPTIFNTGQVLFGWASAYKLVQDKRFLHSMLRAGNWLVSMQDQDGAWRKFSSACTSYALNAYNTRTAWALLAAWSVSGMDSFKQACIKNILWALDQQNQEGWFTNCCLNRNEQPLLHTLAYTIRGILEVGTELEKEEFIAAAKLGADALLQGQHPDGSLAGRYGANWEPRVTWTCPCSILQVACIWLTLYTYTKELKYLQAARKSIAFCKSYIDLNTSNPGVYGGVQGSVPIWSRYGTYQYLNWGAKFLCDALLLDVTLEKQSKQDEDKTENTVADLPDKSETLLYLG